MEDLAKRIRIWGKRSSRILIPHFRQIIRFFLLPYCYFYLVNWEECTRSRLEVAADLIYIFFVLRYFPDNYSSCRLYELPRSQWDYYYGSSYNPYQRRQLIVEVQPQDYQVLFEDKEVCLALCRGNGIPVPESVGFLVPDHSFRPQLEALLMDHPEGHYFSKPVTGSAGSGVFLVMKEADRIQIWGQNSELGSDDNFILPQRHIVQERVEQHESLAQLHATSTNTLRVLTLLGRRGDVHYLSASLRMGVGRSPIDNWSAGGIGVGVDLETGHLRGKGLDKKGRRYDSHPDSGLLFEDFRVPMWPEVLALADITQQCFPYFKLLGLDVAVTPDGPVIIELNAFPDLVGAEQKNGPILANRRVHEEFREYNLLVNSRQRNLYT